jgi:hypothetical protein
VQAARELSRRRPELRILMLSMHEVEQYFFEALRAELKRAGVSVCPTRVAQSYLELAVLVRALEGLTATALVEATPDRSGLWAGLFDLRDNLLGRALDDLRVIAAV